MLLFKKFENPIVRSVIVYSGTVLFVKMMNILATPIFSRLLSVNEFGEIGIYNMYMSVLAIIIGMGINGLLVYGKKNLKGDKYNEFIASGISFTIISFLVIFSIGIIFSDILSNFLNLYGLEYYLIYIHSFFMFISSFSLTYYIYSNQKRKYICRLVLLNLLNISSSIVFILLLKSYKGRILGMILSVFIIGSISIYDIMQTNKFKFKLSLWNSIMKISSPIMINSLIVLIVTQIPIIVLTLKKNVEGVGIYSFSYNIVAIITLLVGAINNAWIPWYIDNMGTKITKKFLYIYLKVVMSIMIIFIFLVPEFLMIISKVEFFGGKYIIPLIMLNQLIVILTNIVGIYEQATGKVRYIAIGSSMNLCFNVIFLFSFWSKLDLIFILNLNIVISMIILLFHLKNSKENYDLNSSDILKNILIVIIAIVIFYWSIELLKVRLYVVLMIIINLLIFVNKKILREKGKR